LCSASSRKIAGTAVRAVPHRRGADNARIAAAPLIWSFTRKTQSGWLVEPGILASCSSTTARTKFFCGSSNSGLPSPSTSADASHGCSIAPPGGSTSSSSKSPPDFCSSTLIFSYGINATKSARRPGSRPE
jgi:hypothetical protein